jgi:hypothetical protein
VDPVLATQRHIPPRQLLPRISENTIRFMRAMPPIREETIWQRTVTLQQHAPEPSATTDTQCSLTRRPAQVADLKATLPRGGRSSLVACACYLTSLPCGSRLSARSWWHTSNHVAWRTGAAGAHQIPPEHAAVIGSTREQTTLGIGPFEAVNKIGVPFEFEKGLTWLSDVEDADNRGVL